MKYICIYISYFVHFLVNITDFLGLLKECRSDGQLCALDERIAGRILLQNYFEISIWI